MDRPDRRGDRAWLSALTRLASSAGIRRAVAAAARAAGGTGPLAAAARPEDLSRLPPTGAPPPEALGTVYEALMEASVRRHRGAWYTPPGVARRVVGCALDRWGEASSGTPVVADPAAGAGAFLVAAARELEDRGVPVPGIPGRLRGADIDRLALEITTEILTAVCGSPPRPEHLVTADIVATPPPWAPVDVVVGNPPFLSPLRRRTARAPERAAAAVSRFGDAARGYVDEAVLFLLAALECVGPGGIVALLLPVSTLGAAHAAAARRRVLDLGGITDLIRLGRPTPSAAEIVAVVVRRTAPADAAPDSPREVRSGVPVGADRSPPGPVVHPPDPAGPPRVVPVDRTVLERSWSPLLGRFPAPEVATSGGTLGDLGDVVADFRDTYYALGGHVADVDTTGAGDPPTTSGRGPARGDPSPVGVRTPGRTTGGAGGQRSRWAPLITTGLIDPARLLWGERPARYLRRRWRAPAVDLDTLPAGGPLERWARARLRPKVLVATQTRVIEAAADPGGSTVPGTPVVSVLCAADDLWRVLAVLLAPPSTALAASLAGGTGLSAGAMRISAPLVRRLPLPADGGPWQRAAGLLAADGSSAVVEAGRLMCLAYRCDPDGEVFRWWRDRLPGGV